MKMTTEQIFNLKQRVKIELEKRGIYTEFETFTESQARIKFMSHEFKTQPSVFKSSIIMQEYSDISKVADDLIVNFEVIVFFEDYSGHSGKSHLFEVYAEFRRHYPTVEVFYTK